MFSFIVDFFKEFIPDKNLPTPAYIARLSVLFLMSLVICVLFYWAIIGTTIGDKWGINRKIPELSNLSHYEFNKSERQVWEALTQLRENDDNVKGTFMAVLYDIRTGNILSKDERKASQAIIWTYSIPGKKFNSLDVIETAINKVKPNFQERFNKNKECFSERLSGEPLQILKRGIQDLESTHFSVCPIFASKGGYLLASSFMLIKLPKDPLEDFKPKDEKNYSDYEILAMLTYQDRLLRTTGLIRDRFENFSTPHLFYYR